VNTGTRLDRESLIRLGWPMERYEFIGSAESLDAFNFVDVKTGKSYCWTRYAVMRSLELFTASDSIVECGICVDSLTGTTHG